MNSRLSVSVVYGVYIVPFNVLLTSKRHYVIWADSCQEMGVRTSVGFQGMQEWVCDPAFH